MGFITSFFFFFFQGAANGFLGFLEQAFLIMSRVSEIKSHSSPTPNPHIFLPDPFGSEGELAIFTDPSH